MAKNWRKIASMQGTIICPYCLKPVEPKDLSRDHVIPKCRGGTQIVLSCKKCNTEKGALTPEEYAEWKRLEKLRHWGKSR